jgi:excisionase family DNA binding protein
MKVTSLQGYAFARPPNPFWRIDMMLNFHIIAILRNHVQEVKRGLPRMPISFSVKVAAQQSGLSERTIHAAIKRGKLKVLRVGRRVLITPAALNEFLNNETTNDSKADA